MNPIGGGAPTRILRLSSGIISLCPRAIHRLVHVHMPEKYVAGASDAG